MHEPTLCIFKPQNIMRQLLLILLGVCLVHTISAQTPTDGLISHWSFDSDTKTKVTDSAGGLIGTPSKIKYEKGVIGSAALFDGKKSKIIITDPNGYPPARITDLKVGTVSFWIKFENRGGQLLPILYLGKNNTSMPSQGMLFEVGHDRGNIENRRLYFTTITSTRSNFCVDSGMNLRPGVWYHYVAVMSNNGSTLYINGIEITTRRYNLGATKQSVSFFDKVSNKEQLSIGYGRYSQEEPFFSFNGLIDDMRIYDRPLSKDEVLQLFDMAGLKMGDPELGYIDARSMIGKEPIERGGTKGQRSNNNSNRNNNRNNNNRSRNSNYNRSNYNNNSNGYYRNQY